jgi:hypothetical protein
MKLTGFLLLPAGWAIVAAAAFMLRAVPLQAAFMLAGLATEIVGLALAIRSHIPVRQARG